MSQAKELLGRTYKNKVSRKSEKVTDLAEFVKAATLKFLPKAYHKSAKAVAQAILDESANYELDPIFLMAVIQNESSFNPKRKGGMGEIGLMQIKPDTAAWIAGAYGLDYKNAKSLYDPVTNVKIGAALMDKLRRQFDSKSRLYVSAYNIGAKKVRSMVEDKKIPKVYVQAVMKRYIAFYSAFKVEGGVKAQSEAAWMNTINLTRKNFLNRKIAEN
jgi:soluble lytic murein transglycosylase